MYPDEFETRKKFVFLNIFYTVKAYTSSILADLL
jgi:hypothetical protein